jgi:hypothetical protein
MQLDAGDAGHAEVRDDHRVLPGRPSAGRVAEQVVERGGTILRLVDRPAQADEEAA